MTNKIGKTPSQPVTAEAADGHLYPAYEMINNVKKWGYVNSAGKFVIKPQYDNAEPFNKDDTARIIQKDKFGIIDKTGKALLEPSYTYVTNFSEGIAVASSSSGNNVIDPKGKVLYSSKNFIGSFSNGMAVTEKQASASESTPLYGYIDKTGVVKISPQYKTAGYFYNNKALVQTKDNKYELIDADGKILMTFPYANMVSFPNGDYYTFTDNSKHKTGYVDANGKVLIDAKFDIAEGFIDGFAIVGINDGNNGSKYGLINTKGEYAVSPQYSSMESLGQGLYSVLKSFPSFSSYGMPKAIINAKGELLSDYSFYDIGKFDKDAQNNMIYVSDENNTYFIDKTGKKVDSLQTFKGRGTLSFDDNIISADIDNQLSYVTKEGKAIWKADNTYSFANNVKVNEMKYHPDRYMLIYYPEISGLSNSTVQSSINEALKKKFIGEGSPVSEKQDGKYTSSLDRSFSASAIGNMMIIEEDGYYYPFGAAHGMPLKKYYHVDMNTGKIYKLSDLFKLSSNYLQKLNAILKNKISEKNKEADSMIFSDQFKGISDEENFFLTKDSLNIFFTPYEIAAYAAGFPTFSINYSEIIDIVNTDGELWKSLGDIKISSAASSGSTAGSSSKSSETAIKDSMDKYEKSLIDAINNNDFSKVEPILYKDSNLYKAQKALITNLNKQGISEKLENYTVDSIEWSADKTQCKVRVEENISIKYPEKEYSTKKFTYTYTLHYSDADSKWQLSDIEK